MQRCWTRNVRLTDVMVVVVVGGYVDGEDRWMAVMVGGTE